MFSPYLFLILLIVPVFVLILRRFYITDNSRMTSQAVGRVVHAEQRVVVEDDRRRTETDVVVQFAVFGREHEIRRILPGERATDFPPNRPVTVRYNPTMPEMADFTAR